MSASDILEAPARLPRRRRRMRIVLGILLACAVLATAYILILLHLADKDLRDAIAEADRLDPGWRLEELEAKRANIPEQQNSAPVVLNAARLLPKPWPPLGADGTAAFPVQEQSLRRLVLAPAEEIDAQQTQDLRTALTKAQSALTEAHKLSDLPTGRYPLHQTPDGGILSIPGNIGLMREMVTLLSFDTLLRAQET